MSGPARLSGSDDRKLRNRVDSRIRSYWLALEPSFAAGIRDAPPTPDDHLVRDVNEVTLAALERSQTEVAGPQARLSVLGEVSLSLLSSDELKKVDEYLDQAWRRDPWMRRLAGFVKALGGRETMNLGFLVKSGCQPDTLAHDLCHAVKERIDLPLARASHEAANVAKHLRREGERLAELAHYVAQHGVSDVIPPGFSPRLRQMADEIAPPPKGDNRLTSRAHLLAALNHVREITEDDHFRRIEGLYNQIRSVAGKEPIAPASVTTTLSRARRHAERLKREFLSVPLSTADTDGI